MNQRKNVKPPEKRQGIREAVIILTDKGIPATMGKIAHVMGLSRSSALMAHIWDLADCGELQAETFPHRGKCPVRFTFTITDKGIAAWKSYRSGAENGNKKRGKKDGVYTGSLELPF